MTTIERLWEKARDDPEQKAIQEALSSDFTLVCNSCGCDSVLDRVSGCYTCKGCGQKACGDS